MSAISAAEAWRNSAPFSGPTEVNQGQPQATTGKKQREMPFFAECKRPVRVPVDYVKGCRDELDALNLCINLSGFPDEAIRDHLGIDKGHFSRIRKGRGNFPPRKRLALMTFCGNLAPIQFEAWSMGHALQEIDKDTRIALLEAQIAAIKSEPLREAA